MIELVDNTGIPYWVDFCKKLGFDDSVAETFNPQYAIGGSNMFASPVQMSSAYSMFANKGVRINSHRVRRIIRRSDNEEVSGNAAENELISEQAAWMMSYLLDKVVTGGYHNYNNLLASPNYEVYAKSGTSDWANDGLQYGIPATAIKDEWSIAYTDKISIACWSGYTTEYFTQGWYIDLQTLDQATAFKINDHLLEYMNNSMGFTEISEPDGISSYNGGYIKTDFLEQGDSTSAPVTQPEVQQPAEDQSRDQTDDATPAEDAAAKSACESSGGTYSGGACACPSGYYLNGNSCAKIEVEPTPEQPSEPSSPEQPDQPNPDQQEQPDQPDQGDQPSGLAFGLLNLFMLPIRRFF